MNNCLFSLIFLFLIYPSFSQNLLSMLDSVAPPSPEIKKVTGMFKTIKIVSMQTPQTVGHGELDFRITHRFGSMGVASNGGIHTLYGFDVAEDIRFSFDYGITRNLQIGIGRSKKMEMLDGSIKWRFLEQTLDNKVPCSMVAYSSIYLTPVREHQLYINVDSVWVANHKSFLHRLSYNSQLILARRVTRWLSLAIAPSYTHRNFVRADINPVNGKTDENGLWALATGIRVKITRSTSLLADYYYIHSAFRKNNDAFAPPLGIGVEIETGGHVFHLTLTNASGITDGYLIPFTTDSWKKGGYKFGFNISRVFQIVKQSRSK